MANHKPTRGLPSPVNGVRSY